MKINKIDITKIVLIIATIGIPLRAIISYNGYNIIILFLLFYTFLLFIKKKILIPKVCIWLLLFLLYSMCSIFYTNYMPGTGWALRRLIPSIIYGICVAILLVSCYRNKQQRIYIVDALLKSYTIVITLISIYLFIFELPLLGGWGRLGKYFFKIESQMVYSYHLYISTSYIIYKILSQKLTIISKIFYYISLILLIIAALLTSIRKIVIFIMLYLILCLLCRDYKNFIRQFKNIIIILGLLILGYYLIMNNKTLYLIIGRRFEALINGLLGADYSTRNYIDLSSIERSLLRKNAWNLFINYPLFGYGLDAFKSYTSNHGTSAVYAHNNYLELLSSIGIIGAIIYYSGIIIILKNNFFNIKNDNRGFSLMFLPLIFLFLCLDYGQVSYYQTSFIFVYVLASIILKK